VAADEIVQIAGALLVLAGFVLAQFNLLDQGSYAYLVPNAIGSGAMAVTAVITANWGFVLLEGAWAAISLWGIVRRAEGAPA
jgi:hypothetical protein